MDSMEKMALQNQMIGLQAQLQVAKSLASSASSMAKTQGISPSGPVTIPALPQITMALDHQIKYMEQMFKFLDALLKKL